MEADVLTTGERKMFHHGKHKGMFRCELAYRLPSEEVEGFVGIGASMDNARQDCLNQINRKLQIIAQAKRVAVLFEHSRLIESADTLTAEEIDTVKRDWACEARYR
jgi:hypothetical protein